MQSQEPHIIDLHTHRAQPGPHALRNLSPADAAAIEPGRYYSVGIHPWQSGSPVDTRELERVAALPQVLAVGESGIDHLRGGSIAEQSALFEAHIALSERLRKPLIVHCVRAAAELMALHRRIRPTQPWVIHGFAGKPQAAAQWLGREGIALSLGARFNPQSAALVPADRLFVESDESPLAIEQIVAAVAQARGEEPDTLRRQIEANTRRLLHPRRTQEL